MAVSHLLDNVEKEIKDLQEIAQNIDNNTHGIVCGYSRDLVKQTPLEIIDLIYCYVGNHFTKMKDTESTQRIMGFIADTREPLCEYNHYRHGVAPHPCIIACYFCIGGCLYVLSCCACFNCCCHGCRCCTSCNR
eukprot:461334_1